MGSRRPVPALSDALRYEVRVGRAKRVERGVYAIATPGELAPPVRRSTPPLPPIPPPGITEQPTPLDPVLDEDPATWTQAHPAPDHCSMPLDPPCPRTSYPSIPYRSIPPAPPRPQRAPWDEGHPAADTPNRPSDTHRDDSPTNGEQRSREPEVRRQAEGVHRREDPSPWVQTLWVAGIDPTPP